MISGNRIIMGGQTSDAASDFFLLSVVSKMAPSETTVGARVKGAKIVAKGKVSPKHAGKKVFVKLEKKKGGKFVKVASKRAKLNARSSYKTTFKNPTNATKCRVTTKFSGDAAHKPSGAKKKFAC